MFATMLLRIWQNNVVDTARQSIRYCKVSLGIFLRLLDKISNQFQVRKAKMLFIGNFFLWLLIDLFLQKKINKRKPHVMKY